MLFPTFRIYNSVASGDYDGDGDIDLAFGDRTSGLNIPLVLQLNNGSGLFPNNPVEVDVERTILSDQVRTIDFNRDGRPDLANGQSPLGLTSMQSRKMALYINNGALSFTRRVFPIADGASSLTVGDLGADGLPDLIFGNQGGGLRVRRPITILRNKGGGFIHPGTPVSGGDTSGFSKPTLCDLDLDGANDLVVTNDQRGSFSRRLWIP